MKSEKLMNKIKIYFITLISMWIIGLILGLLLLKYILIIMPITLGLMLLNAILLIYLINKKI